MDCNLREVKDYIELNVPLPWPSLLLSTRKIGKTHGKIKPSSYANNFGSIIISFPVGLVRSWSPPRILEHNASVYEFTVEQPSKLNSSHPSRIGFTPHAPPQPLCSSNTKWLNWAKHELKFPLSPIYSPSKVRGVNKRIKARRSSFPLPFHHCSKRFKHDVVKSRGKRYPRRLPSGEKQN